MTTLFASALILAACGDSAELASTPTEILLPITWQETTVVEGEIKTAEKTPLNVPGAGWDSRTLMAMVAVGYAGDANQLPDELKARELAARKRKPIGDLFFDSAWNQSI